MVCHKLTCRQQHMSKAAPASLRHTRLHWAADTSTVSLLSGPEVSSVIDSTRWPGIFLFFTLPSSPQNSAKLFFWTFIAQLSKVVFRVFLAFSGRWNLTWVTCIAWVALSCIDCVLVIWSDCCGPESENHKKLVPSHLHKSSPSLFLQLNSSCSEELD